MVTDDPNWGKPHSLIDDGLKTDGSGRAAVLVVEGFEEFDF